MKCEACLPVIDQFFEGDLDERASGEISAHIASCVVCTNAFEELQREQEIYSRYLLDIEPTPAVWAGVSAGIAKEKSALSGGFLHSFRHRLSGAFTRPRLSPLLAAAAVVMMLGIAFVLVRYLNRNPSGPTPEFARQDAESGERQPMNNFGTNANRPGNPTGPVRDNPRAMERDQQESLRGAASVKRPQRSYVKGTATRDDRGAIAQSTPKAGASAQIVIDAEKKYREAVAVLARDLERRRSHLSPQKLATVEQALSIIDQTIARTSRAAREHPTDPLTARYMLAAYTEKIDLLREATF